MDDDAVQVFRAWVGALAADDPRARRFGARHHRHRLAPPLGEARVAALEAALGLRLPDDYRGFVGRVADGGAGPYHGLLPLDHPVQRRCAAGSFRFTAPADDARAEDVHAGVLGLGHVGCGQVALLVVRGEAAGEVWLDAREADAGIGPIAPSFTAYLEEWVERTARGELPRALVPAGRCALPAALSSYLARCEDVRGLARGTLGGDALRGALQALGPGAIAVVATRDGPFFAPDDPLDPCPASALLIENLRARGLAADAVAPGLPPVPALRP